MSAVPEPWSALTVLGCRACGETFTLVSVGDGPLSSDEIAEVVELCVCPECWGSLELKR